MKISKFIKKILINDQIIEATNEIDFIENNF